MAKPKHDSRGSRQSGGGEEVVGLRIIGGSLRGRKLAYTGDIRTRPMKDRVREAVFNLLGRGVAGTHAIDLFAGTGALGLEALSRGATKATFIERHYPTAKVIEQNIGSLGLGERAQVVFGDAFSWTAAFTPSEETPLCVFCSPPYDFFVDRHDPMLALIAHWVTKAPRGSLVVVESDERCDTAELESFGAWDVRTYPPAIVAILEIGLT